MSDSSRIFGVSLRGWIAFTVIYTVCMMALLSLDVKEPLYTLATAVVAYYFGQEKGKASNTTP
jgi:hypothetical protein